MVRWSSPHVAVLGAVLLVAMLSVPVVPVASAAVSGEDVYSSKCQTCHGVDGSGRGNLLDTTDLSQSMVWKANTRASLRETVVNGRGNMPAFGWILSEQEVEAALGYASGLAGVEWSEIPEGPSTQTDAVSRPGLAAFVGMVIAAIVALLLGRRQFR